MSLADLALDAVRATAGKARKAASRPEGEDARRSDAAMADPRVRECRRMVSRQALLGASVSLLPVPGLDMAADAALLARLIHRINFRFGLSQAQVEAMAPERKALVFKAAGLVGSTLVGRAIGVGLVTSLLKAVGVRLTAGQAARLVPLAGNVVTASLAYLAMRHVLFRHIDDCARVSAQLRIAAPVESARASGTRGP